jgi:hypothetical protein
MTTRLTWGRGFADESFGGAVHEMELNSGARTEVEQPRMNFVARHAIAEMSLPALLYYVLFGEGSFADEAG